MADLTAQLAALKVLCKVATREGADPTDILRLFAAAERDIPAILEYVQQVEASVCSFCHEWALRQARERMEKALEGNNG